MDQTGGGGMKEDAAMALYLVVHHRRDEKQPWQNAWLDDDRLQAISTTAQIGRLCAAAQQNHESLFVHRCGWSGIAPLICCGVRVARVSQLPGGSSLVEFDQAIRLSG